MPHPIFDSFKSGPPKIAIDRFGNIIEAGHLVLYHNDQDLVMEVIDVTPVLNPNLPPGVSAMQIRLEVKKMIIQTMAASPFPALIVVGKSETRTKAEAKAAGNGRPTVVEDPPPQELIDEGPAQCPACGHRSSLLTVDTTCSQCGDGIYRVIAGA